MSTLGQARFEALLPSEEDEKQALIAKQAMIHYFHEAEGRQLVSVRLHDERGRTDHFLPLPESAAKLLVDVLTHIANGNAVMVLPVHREISTQQAADLLNVSRPHLIRMLERGDLPFRQVGTRRKVQLKDVLAYKARQAAERRRVLDELTAQAEELGLY
jgi:excisionase family DNA binding protein